MIPFLINTPEPMLRVRIVTLRDDVGSTVTRVQELGVLHVEEAQELGPMDILELEKQKNRVHAALGHVNEIIAHLPGERTVRISGAAPAALDEIIAGTSHIYNRVAELARSQDSLTHEITRLRETGKYLELLAGKIDLPVRDLRYSGNYLFTDVAVFSAEPHRLFLERAGDYCINEISASREGEVVSAIVARTAHRREIQSLVTEFAAIHISIPEESILLSEYLEKAMERISSREEALAALQKETARFIGEHLEEIVLMREVLEREESRFQVLEMARGSRFVTLLTGWIPEPAGEHVTRGIREHLPYAFVETRKPSDTDEPPTKLRNPRAIKPFEILVHLFGLPKYGDWDPTPAIAYSFALFFGLMLNDMAYGIGLIVVARLVLDRLVDDPASEGTRLFRNLLYTSGTVAALMGVLSGSYLGDFFTAFFGVRFESLALSSWVQTQLSDPISFIILAIVIGLVHLNIAHGLGLARGIKERTHGLIVLKAGLFVMQVFGIPWLLKSMLSYEILALGSGGFQFFFYCAMAGVGLVIIGAFMEYGGLGAIFWVFEITGVLGDVMSYCRLAGVGLATYYLASSFNLIARWVSQVIVAAIPGAIGLVLGFIAGTLLLVVFHVFNVFLGSLSAFIHSLRLCFVEFLLKFFDGGGREYSPFHVRVRKEVVVGKKT